jgi:hypothetical protein
VSTCARFLSMEEKTGTDAAYMEMVIVDFP